MQRVFCIARYRQERVALDKSCMQLIREYIERAPRGSVFAKVDFDGYGSDNAIRMALSRLVRDGVCVRMLPSVYYRAGGDSVGGAEGKLDACEIGMAIARNYGWKAILGTEMARKELGLSLGTPEQVVLTSTGPSRAYSFPRCGEVRFRQSRARFLREMSGDSATVVNALMGMKDDGILEDDLREIGKRLTEEQKQRLLQEKELAPKFLWRHLEFVCGN